MLVFLVIWGVLSAMFPRFLLPSPAITLRDTIDVLWSYDFWSNAGLTLWRSVSGFFWAFVFANLTAALAAASASGKKFLWPLITIGNTFPGIVATFIAVVVLGSYGPVAMTVEVMLLGPLLFFVLYPAYDGLREDLREVAVVFRISRYAYVRSFVLPQLAPSLFAAVRTGLSNGWKVVVTAEVFTLGGGVGYRILQYFNLFSLRHVFAWLLGFLCVMLLIEYGIIAPIERRIVGKRSTA